MTDLETLKYPIGRFRPAAEYTPDDLQRFIRDIRQLPSLVEIAVQNLDEYQLQTPYRPEGWTIVQVVHHLADSHINAITRFKLALTEDNPVIKPYDEGAWANLEDVQSTPINYSITLLHALHTRWANLMEAMPAAGWERTFFHPDNKITYPLKMQAAMYSWHGQHHLEQILQLKQRMNW